MDNKALTLPDEATFTNDLMAINKFQNIVRANMVEGHDFGVIPGTKKPTLLKPGAEKIAKLLGLSDLYEIIDRQEDWDKPFFRVVIAEGLGECNSLESKYRWRWVFPSDVPENLEKGKLLSREINTKRGKAKQYRLENEDIYSQVNTILKMAKKRALVDASLSAGRLSDVFTQDVEDMGHTTGDIISGEEDAKATPPNLATEAQLKKIFASGKQMGYQDEDIKGIIKTKWGVESTKELSKSQASELIQMIEKGEGVESAEAKSPFDEAKSESKE